MTIVKASYIFGKFFNLTFFILENVIPQMALPLIYQTCVLLLVNNIYAMENKHVLGIYAVVNKVTLRPKEIIHMFVT